jgi:hypothetical protein
MRTKTFVVLQSVALAFAIPTPLNNTTRPIRPLSVDGLPIHTYDYGLCQDKCPVNHNCLEMPNGVATCIWEGYHTREMCDDWATHTLSRREAPVMHSCGEGNICVRKVRPMGNFGHCIHERWKAWDECKKPHAGVRLNDFEFFALEFRPTPWNWNPPYYCPKCNGMDC